MSNREGSRQLALKLETFKDLFLIICYFPTYWPDMNGLSRTSSHVNAYRTAKRLFPKYYLPVYTSTTCFFVLHNEEAFSLGSGFILGSHFFRPNC